jgi:hypothetical protein
MADSAPLQFGRINIWAWLSSCAARDIGILPNDGAPVNGTSGTGVGKVGPGCLLVDYTNKFLYINTNTKASPTWTKVGTQS